MSLPDTIALVGACTETGNRIAHALAGKHFRLLFADRNVERIPELYGGILPPDSEEAADCMTACFREACWEADLILMAVTWKDLYSMLAEIRPVVTGKIMVWIDSENAGEEKDGILREQLPYSHVVRLNPSAAHSGPCYVFSASEKAAEVAAGLLVFMGWTPELRTV